MREKVELCTEIEGEHRGTTRDPAHLVFRLRSVLDAGEGICRIWALRAVTDGFPIEFFFRIDRPQQLDTCWALGFIATDTLGHCDFGMDPAYSKCGFPVTTYMRWGTYCQGCQQNNGEFDHYVLQGPMTRARVITSFDGAIFTRCRVR
jgi:hypothetical protein